jgi:hypothetical protein
MGCAVASAAAGRPASSIHITSTHRSEGGSHRPAISQRRPSGTACPAHHRALHRGEPRSAGDAPRVACPAVSDRALPAPVRPGISRISRPARRSNAREPHRSLASVGGASIGFGQIAAVSCRAVSCRRAPRGFGARRGAEARPLLSLTRLRGAPACCGTRSARRWEFLSLQLRGAARKATRAGDVSPGLGSSNADRNVGSLLSHEPPPAALTSCYFCATPLQPGSVQPDSAQPHSARAPRHSGELLDPAPERGALA